MSLFDNFPHTATALRRRRTADSYGGSKDSFPTTVFTGRACWRQLASDRDITEFDKRGIIVTDKVYFLTDPALDARDTLTIGSDVLEVVSKSIPDATAGLGVAWRVMCVLTTTGSTP